MSNLRIIGLIVGIIGLLLTFLFYRGPKWKRSNFILFSLFNLCLIMVSVNPNVLNILRDALSLQKAQRGRILALLVISNVFLLFFVFYTKSKLENFLLQFDKLVRNLGSNEIEKIGEVNNHIKPVMILIPAFNEADNLRELLPRIPKHIGGIEVGVLVIDDGSEDETFSVVDETEGAIVVKNPINRGGGAALRLGYDILKKAGARFCITMDADGQHQPEEVEKIALHLVNDQYDFVIGSRILGDREKDNLLRYIGVQIFGKIVSFLLGKKVTDPSSGFRGFRMEAMAAINLYENQYHTSELIIEAIKKDMRIGEVPITILKRKYGKSKKGTDWRYGLRFARTIIKTWWR
ncbi:MAG: glycosyltransferase family 2 protein [Deltaproteobacteria bacterium]|nr:glycosyltransferase family 2 protein [Deltaproteobacteria bacterium]